MKIQNVVGQFSVKSVATGTVKTFKVEQQDAKAEFAPNERILSVYDAQFGSDQSFAFVKLDGRIITWRRFRTTNGTPTEYEQLASMLSNMDAHEQAGRIVVSIGTEPTEQEAESDTASVRGALQFLCDSFVVAIGYGLKRPQIRLHYKDQRFKVYLSKKGTVCIKSGMLEAHSDGNGNTTYSHDPIGDEFYVGCLLRGKFMPAKERESLQQAWDAGRHLDMCQEVERPLTATEQEFLAKLAEDPVGFMAQCSRDMDRCCYCNLPLEDLRSKARGYGPVCAKRWGLPWGDEKHAEKLPSFASLHDENATGLCDAIRANPTEKANWLIFADWLQERGLPPCKMPDRKVVMPRS